MYTLYLKLFVDDDYVESNLKCIAPYDVFLYSLFCVTGVDVDCIVWYLSYNMYAHVHCIFTCVHFQHYHECWMY